MSATTPVRSDFDTTMSTFHAPFGQMAAPQLPDFQRRRDTNLKGGNEPPHRVYVPHRSPETVDGTWSSCGESRTRASFIRYSGAYSTTPLTDRVTDTPPLPAGWSEDCDRLICKIDVLGYDHARIVQKIRQLQPRLRGVLTPAMIDKRLRQLDQDIEIDYWRAGLQYKHASEAREVEDAGEALGPKSAREGIPANAQLSQHTALQRQEGERRHQEWISQYGSSSNDREDSRFPSVRRQDPAYGK